MNQANELNQLNQNSAQSDKKPYNKPDLRVYGDIRVITQSITMTHPTADAGAFPNPTKTG